MPHTKQRLESLFLSFTFLCNLKCDMCDIWQLKERGPSLGTIEKILKEAKKLGAHKLYLSGGEPFMRDDALEAIECAHRLGYVTNFVTNGSLLNKMLVKKLSKLRVNVTVSLEGSKECHDSMRGRGTYEMAISAIKMLRERHFLICLSMVITRQSYHYMKDLVDTAKALDVFSIGYQPFSRRNTWLRKEMWDKYIVPENEISGLINMINETVYYARQKRVILQSVHLLHMMPEYFRLREKIHPLNGCSIPFKSLAVNIDGLSVIPCVFHLDYIVGDMDHSSLAEIWNGEEFAKSRSMARQKLCRGCLSGCSDLEAYRMDGGNKDSPLKYLSKRYKILILRLRQRGLKWLWEEAYFRLRKLVRRWAAL